MHTIEVADDPWAVLHYTKELTNDLPALINCNVCRAYWHVGVGTDGPPEWDRYEIVKNELSNLGHKKSVMEIEEQVCQSMETLWNRKLLLKPLKQ